MTKKFLILPFSFFILYFSSAQDMKVKDAIPKSVIDTTYVEDFSDKVMLRFLMDNSVDKLNLSNDAGNDIIVVPNNYINTTFSAKYKFLLLAISLPRNWGTFEKDTDIKGTSERFSLALNLFFNKWWYNASYERTDGYYVANTADFVENWNEGTDAYIQLPNLTFKKYSGSVGYIFNSRKFSYKSFLLGTEIQKKSAGSILVGFSVAYKTLTNSEAISPFDKLNRDFISAAVSGGYQYNWVPLKGFCLSGGTNIGGGVVASKLEYSKNTERIGAVFYSPSLSLKFNFSLTYHYKNLLSGIRYKADSYMEKYTSKAYITNNVRYGEFYICYMFNKLRF